MHRATVIAFLACVAALAAAKQVYHDKRALEDTVASWRTPKLDEDVQRLLSSLTIQEKIGQMLQIDIQMFRKNPGKTLEIDLPRLAAFVDRYFVGSVLNSPSSDQLPGIPNPTSQQWRQIIRDVQQVFLTHGSKVPMIYGLDTVHGANYIYKAALFPQQLTLAATFNRSHAFATGAVGAKDTRYVGIPWVFAPILDLTTHQMHPRYYESFGEDPYLISEMGKAIITGMQGNGSNADLAQPYHVAACAKHFIGYQFPRNGQDRGPVWIPNRILKQLYVPSFQAAVDVNTRTFMESYNELNGVPVGASKEYLNDLLRDEMGFKGMLVTDYNVLTDLKDLHHVTPDYRTATFTSVNKTSIDMMMMGSNPEFFDHLLALVQSGVIPESRVDMSVGRLLQLKKDLGIMDKPMPPEIPDPVGRQADLDAATDACRESIVLVKNDGNVLPFAFSGQEQEFKDTDRQSPLISKLAVIGPTGHSITYQSGGWTLHWQGAVDDSEFPYGSSVFTALQKLVGARGTVTYSQGCNIDGSYSQQQMEEAVRAAQAADAVIVGLGERQYAEAPGNIHDLLLPQGQQDLLARVKQAAGSKPVVLLLLEGRPRVLNGIASLANAVLFAGLPGPQGGVAIAETIFGINNPSGRLPFSYPRYTGDVPMQYWHSWSQAVTVPEWSFGTGLSYTRFQYSQLQLSSQSIRPTDSLTVYLTVTNVGSRPGRDAVLLYLSDDYRSVAPEVKLLKRFDKVLLAPNEQRRLMWVLTPHDFSFIGLDEGRIVEPGSFTIAVGDQIAKFTIL